MNEVDRKLRASFRVHENAAPLKRVLPAGAVPAEEKVVSVFEEHTDIIRKDRRETLYGHKVCLTGGSSSMILDCVILDGNPADSTLAETMIDRQVELYERAQRPLARSQTQTLSC